MSKRSTYGVLGASRWLRGIAVLAFLLMVGVVASPAAVAQDEEECFVAMTAAHEHEAPAEGEATPEAEAEEPVSTTAEGDVADTIIAAVTEIGGCNEGFTATNPLTWSDGRVSADVHYMVTPWQLASERWILAMDGDAWVFDAFAYMPPDVEVDTAVVGINLTGAIEPNRVDAGQVPALIFHVINATEDHANLYVLVATPDGIAVAGMITNLEAGGEADLTLLDAPAATFVVTTDMVEFTVVAPEA